MAMVATQQVRGAWQRLRAQHWRWQPWQTAHGLYLALPAHWPVHADDAALLDAVLTSFDAWCADHAGQRCELALGAAATLWQVAPMERPSAEALGLAWSQAFAQWAHYLDLDLREPGLLDAWQLQEAQAPGAAVLAATPRALTQGLMAVADRHGVRIDWMGPWWVRALARWMAGRASPQADGANDRGDVCDGVVHMAEPGWTWRVSLHRRPAMASPRWGWRSLARQARPTPHGDWTLVQLHVDGAVPHDESQSLLASLVLNAPGAPGVQAEHPSCVPVDLAVLQGVSVTWGGA